MVGIVAGLGLGLQNSSSARLGASGMLGQAQFGRGNERVYVNAATGNLVLQQLDEFLSSSRLNINLNRTYNSQGQADDNHHDNWRLGYSRSVNGLTGSLNSVGSKITRTAEDGSQLTYTYDAASQTYLAKAAHGGTYSLRYDAANQQWIWQDGANNLKEYYDANQQGRLTKIQDQDGNQISLSYNGSGLITVIRNSNGDALHIDYDTAAGKQANILQLRTESTSGGVTATTQRVRYQYDGSNRLTQVIVDLSPEDGSIADGNTYVTQYQYSGTSNRISNIKQSDGSELAFEYVLSNGQYRISTVQDIRSATDVRITRFAYGAVDGSGKQTTTITDAAGVQSQLTYNSLGQLLSIKGPLVNGQREALNYTYDTQGNVASITDARGGTTVYKYDDQGNRIYERDALGNTVERTYNSDNKLLSETSYTLADPDGDGPGRPQGAQTTHYIYDANGHARFIISPEGRVTEQRYDSAGRPSSQIQYSAAKINITGLSNPPTLSELNTWAAQQNLSQTQRVDTTYDLRGQISEITRYSEVDAAGNGLDNGSRTHYIYDASGNLLQTIDSRGAQTHYIYDGLNRLISQRDALGNVTTTVYLDKQGQTQITLANGLSTLSQYDKSGQLSSVQIQDSSGILGTTSYQYDSQDRLRCITDPLGQKSYLLYDAAGRQVGQIDAKGTLTESRYNLAGQVIQTIVYAKPVSAALLNNPLTLELAQVRPVLDSANDRRQFNLYDLSGRLIQHIQADGAVSTLRYDGAGRLIETLQYANRLSSTQLSALSASATELLSSNPNVQVSANAASDRSIRQLYDADGLLVGTLDAEGYLTEQRYDASARLIETIRYATVTNQSQRATGSLAQLRPVAAGADQHSQYFYDAQSRLIGTIDAEGYLSEYRYDTNGNKSSEVRYANKAKVGADLASTRPATSTEDLRQSYEYDELGRLIRKEQQPTGLVSTFTYDVQGNLIQTDLVGGVADKRTQLARYDSQGRLIGEMHGEGAAALAKAEDAAQIEAIWAQYGTHHRYDAAGQRIATTTPDGVSGRTSLYYYDSVGRLTHSINPLGEVMQHHYDTFGQMTWSRSYANRLSTEQLETLIGGDSTELTVLLIALQSDQDILLQNSYNQRGQLSVQENALGQQIRYAYDAFGQLAHQYNPLPSYLKTDYFYDKRGLLTNQTTDASGFNIHTSQSYDAFGRVIASTDARGATNQFSYDRLGRQISQTNAHGAQNQIVYDAFGRTLSSTDALGNTTTWQHNGNTLTQTSPGGIQTISQSNEFGETIQVIDGKGNATSYEYDLNGQLIKVTGPAGETRSVYDIAGQQIQSIDARGVVTEYSYDAAGRVLTRTLDPTGLALTTRYQYDAFGRTSIVIDARGQITETQYDVGGQVLSVIQDVGGLNLTTTYKYDEAGRTVEVISAAGSPAAQMTRYSYDTLGRRISESIDPEGLNLSNQYQYDQNGNVLVKTDALGHQSRYAYDALGQLVYTLDALGSVSHNVYDANGQLILSTRYATALDMSSLPANPSVADIESRIQTSANDQTQRSVYNADGQISQRIDALGYVTELKYDTNGNLIQSTRYAQKLSSLPADGQRANPVASSADQTSLNYYDAANRLSHSIDAEGYMTQYEYDAAGNVLHTIQYAFKDYTLGQPPLVVGNKLDHHTYAAYDAAGRQVISVNTEGYASQNWYDAAGNVTRSVRYATALNNSQISTLAQIYPQNQELMPLSSADLITHNRYDTANRLIESQNALGVVTAYQYDAVGRVIQSTQAFGTEVAVNSTFTYDAAGRLLEQTDAAGSNIARTQRYSYDAAGNRLSFIDARGIEAAETDTAWALDTRKALGMVDANGQAKIAINLTDVEKTQLQQRYSSHFAYDSLGRQISQTDALGNQTKTEYDAFGNAVKITDPRGNSGHFYFDARNQATLSVDPTGSAVRSSYDAFGKVTQITRYSHAVVGAQVGSEPIITTDVLKDQTTRIEHDKRNLQTKITDAEGYTETLSYDAFGNKASYTNKLGGTFTYQYDLAGRVTQETLPIQSKNAAGTLVSVRKTYEYDARGNLIKLTEAVGLPEQRVSTYTYDALDRQTQVSILTQSSTGAAVTAKVQESSTYDALGQVIEQTDANGGITRHWYNQLGQKVAERNSTGTLSEWDYDAAGNAIAQRIYADAVAVGSKTPVDVDNVRLTQYRFDAANKLVATIVPEQIIGSRNPVTGNYEISKTDLVTRYQYDATGNVIVQTDARGNNTYRYYDKVGRKVLEIDSVGYATTWQYDAAGNITQEHRYANKPSISVHTATAAADILASLGTDASNDRISQFTYDKMNRVVTEKRLNVLGSTVNSINGQVTEARTDAITQYQYNGLGKVTEQTNALNGKSNYQYDVIGRETQRQAVAYVDYRGISVRPTTDSEYNGLDQISRNINRGENSVADGQITHYQYGAGGLLLSQTDPTGARTSFEYNNAGQISRNTIHEYNGSQISTDYRYDAAGREIERKDITSGMRYEIAYNSYGEVIGKRTSTTGTGNWQEYAEYDNAGRIIKSNSGGSQKAYLYDANGNATLQIEAPTSDLKSMTIDQIINLNGNNQVFRTITQFDQANRVTDIYQPTMSQARDLVVIKQWITVTPNDSSGGVVEVGPNGKEVSAPNTNPLANGSVSISGNGQVNPLIQSSATFGPAGIIITYLLPDNYQNFGDGAFHTRFSMYWPKGISFFTWQSFDTYSSNVVRQADGRYAVVFNVLIPNAHLLYRQESGCIRYQLNFLSKATPYGEAQISANNSDRLAVLAYPYTWVTYGFWANEPASIYSNSKVFLKGQPLGTDKVLMQYRPLGSNQGWQSISVSRDSINGQIIGGQFVFDWSHLPHGTYEFQYQSLDTQGKVLNSQYGHMTLNGNPAIWQSPQPIYGAGKAFLDSANNLQITQLGAQVKKARISIRTAGGNWVTYNVNAIYGGGWITLSQAAHGLKHGQAYDYIVEGMDASGNLIKKSVGSFVHGNPNTVSALTAYQDQAQIVHFKNQNLSATYGVVRYRKTGSAVWSEAKLTKNGAGQFYWDATGLFTDKLSSADYEYEYLLYNQKDELINHAEGKVRLGKENRLISHQSIKIPVVVSFTSLDNQDLAGASTISLYYRPEGSHGAYQSISILQGSKGQFDFNVDHLMPESGSVNYEYYYEQYNASGQPYVNALGETIQTEGVLHLDSKQNQDGSSEIRYVITGVANDDITIHRSQKYNAFGEIIQEIDGLGRITEFEYNTFGKLIQKRDPETTITQENGAQVRERPTTRYYYDLMGNVVGMRDANGNLNSQILLAGSEGDQIRVAKEIHADGGDKTAAFDIFGNLRRSTDEIGRQTTYVYDLNDRLIRMNRSNGGYDSYEYDARSQRIAHSTTSDGLNVFRDTTRFDTLGRVTQTISAAGRKVDYSYRWDAAILGAGGAIVGGWRTTKLDDNNRTLIDDNDVFGRLVKHVDLGGHIFSYVYNHGGQLTKQTGSTGQNITYTYYGNGYIKDMADHAIDSYTFYEYDSEGNRTFEGYTTVSGGSRQYYQYAEVTYDELNRIKSINDPKFRINYEYDAVGNRRRVQSYYHDGVSGQETLQDYWYRYDNMNRFVVTMGSFNGERGSGYITAGGLNKEGVAISYNAAGERISAWHARDGHTETYNYDAGGFLANVYINGILRTARTNDLLGRTTTYVEAISSKWIAVTTNSTYDADSLLTFQSTYSFNAVMESELSNTAYFRHGDGTVNYISNASWQNGNISSPTMVFTHYGYEWWDEAKQSTITSQPFNMNAPGWLPGMSKFAYDVNGHLKQAFDMMGGRSLRYTTNAQGLILRRDEIDLGVINLHHDYYYLDGKRIGDVGNDGNARVDYAQSLAQSSTSRDLNYYIKWRPVSSADFDQNYEPIGPGYPGQALTHYTVRAGDTLQSIALSIWGDSALWYLLADANGLSGSIPLTANQVLTIPNKVTNVHNNSSTMRVYSPGEAIGDTSPTLPMAPPPPPAPKKKGCGGIGKIFVAIVAVVVTVFTAGVAAVAMGATSGIMSAGMGAVTGGMLGSAAGLSLGTTIAAAAIGGAVGSIASQGVAIGMGLQDKFSWGQVGLAGLSAGVTAGLSSTAISNLGLFDSIGKVGGWAESAARAMVGSAVTQGISVATGLQDKFSWTAVAAAGIGAAFSSEISRHLGPILPQNQFLNKFVTGAASSTLQSAIQGQKLNWAAIAADSFGSALGNQLVELLKGDDQGRTPAPSSADDTPQEIRDKQLYTLGKNGSAASIARERLGSGASEQEVRIYAAQILEENGISNPRAMAEGMQLILPDANTPFPSAGLGIYDQDGKLGEHLRAVAVQNEMAQQVIIDSEVRSVLLSAGVSPDNQSIDSVASHAAQFKIKLELGTSARKAWVTEDQIKSISELANAYPEYRIDIEDEIRRKDPNYHKYQQMTHNVVALPDNRSWSDSARDFLNQNNHGEPSDSLWGAILNTVDYFTLPFAGSGNMTYAAGEGVNSVIQMSRSIRNFNYKQFIHAGLDGVNNVATKVGTAINGATRTVPLGFTQESQFLEAAQDLQNALRASGINDAVVGVRGSSVTGSSFAKGTPFSPKSDIDFFVESAQLTNGYKTSKNIPGFVHPGKILPDYPALQNWSTQWAKILGRDVTPGAFKPGTLPNHPSILVK